MRFLKDNVFFFYLKWTKGQDKDEVYKPGAFKNKTKTKKIHFQLMKLIRTVN